MIVGTRDPFGFRRLHYVPGQGDGRAGWRSQDDASSHFRGAVSPAGPDADTAAAYGAGIRQALQAAGATAGDADMAAIHGYFSGSRLAGHTLLRNVRAVPPGHALERTACGWAVHAVPLHPMQGNLHALLRDAVQRALDSGQRVALALSGGLDSALLLALLKELGAQRDIPSYILATGLPDYCERAPALDIAQRLGARVKVVQATGHDFVAALPRAARCVEEPMFNLHPVAKLLLADAMAADGIDAAISGDGADQVLRRDVSANYLPLCNALFDAASVPLHAPFIDPAVVQHLVSLPPDPDKHCLRALGSQLNLPDRLVRGPKRSRLAPAMDLSPVLDRDRILALARTLDMDPPALHADTERMLWTTLTMTLDTLRSASS